MQIFERTVRTAEIHRVATEGAIWGLPLVLSDLVRRAHPAQGRFFRLPADAALLAPGLVGSHGDMTVCSAVLDVAVAPVFLSAPSGRGAYRLLQLIDAWGRTLATCHLSETGDSGRPVAVVGPNWTGKVPEGATRVQASGGQVWASCHLLESAGDVQRPWPAVSRACSNIPAAAGEIETLSLGLQKGFDEALRTMTPISFFRRLARLTPLAPPDPASADIVRALIDVGLASTDPLGWPPDEIAALHEGAVEGLRRVRRLRSQLCDPGRNGWARAPSGVLGHLPPLERAANALAGLGAPPAEDILSFVTRVDASGRPLTGGNDYSLDLAAQTKPPANAFWSAYLIDGRGFPVGEPSASASAGSASVAGGLFELAISSPCDDGAGHRLSTSGGPFGLRLDLHWPASDPGRNDWSPPGIVYLWGRHAGARTAFARLPRRSAAPPASRSSARSSAAGLSSQEAL